jgi:cellulose synthase (UDP-forming)
MDIGLKEHPIELEDTADSHPPEPVRAEFVMRRADYVAFALLAGINMATIAYFATYWFSSPRWFIQPALFSFTTLLLLIVLINYLGRWLMLLLMKRPVLPKLRWHPRVGVATTFVPGAETLDMLERTVRALVEMDYPHDTWVLDEGAEPRVRAMCERVGAKHFSRADLSRYQAESGPFQAKSKHGNVNAWLHEHAFARYDVVTLFDPDHVASRSFLERVLGYFEDQTIGYVQAAQAYYNQASSLIARGAAEETYAYNSSIQMAAYSMGYPVIVGCHNTHRVTALREIGGLQAHDADDLLTTLAYQSHGWGGVFVPEILARGLAPVDWPSYLTQQRRWARSVLDVKLRLHPRMSSSLTLRTRVMSFLHGLNYLYRSFVLFASLVLIVYTLATSIGSSVFDHLISPQTGALCLILLACDFYRQRFYLDWRSERGLHWRVAVLHFAKWPHMLAALRDVILNRRFPYAITPKIRTKTRRLGLFAPHFLAALVVAGAWGVGAWFRLNVSMEARELAGAFILCTLGLVFSGLLPTPEPFDRDLLVGARPSSDRPGT